ncbi:MAG TPA: M48 family metallopeptidase [Candidatus Eisenbacteria bacterium]|jgi:heat shock protein HtpX|nr:M48 family metallopeptidase [Candidatus Eisenbacteria bacterium]
MTTYDFIAANKRKTVMLIAVFSALVLLIGWVIDQYYGGGGFFVGIAAIYSTISALVSYYAGDKVALAVSGARQVTSTESPYVVRMVENLAISQGMPTPKVYLIEDDSINAFATGRDPKHSSIAVTTGAVRKLENEELEGVLAHEMSHVKNYDIRVMTIVIVLVGVVSVLANMMFRASFYGGRRRDRNSGSGVFLLIGLALMIFAPIIAQLIKLAVSRRREYLADASGALMTRFPEGLARALAKIQRESMPMANASPATAHLFIANPFSGKALAAVFSTHPPIEARIAALQKMSNEHLA